MENKIKILGVLIRNRQSEAGQVQNVFTKYGCSIKTRLGLNENDSDENALILLELIGDESEMKQLENDLLEIEGVEIQKMEF